MRSNRFFVLISVVAVLGACSSSDDGGDTDGTMEQNQSGGVEDRTNFGDTGNTSVETVTISGNTGLEGVSGTDKNLPPYFAIAYIIRVS